MTRKFIEISSNFLHDLSILCTDIIIFFMDK